MDAHHGLDDAKIGRRESPKSSPLPSTAISRSMRECPKCSARNSSIAKECRSCGIVFARYRADEGERVAGEIQLTGSLELVSQWHDLMDDYHNEARHHRFIRACDDAGCLPFASQKYARILSVAPDEEIAKKMRKYIVGLASHKFERASAGGWKFRIPGFNAMAILLGTIVSIIGHFAPPSQARNLTGIGVSLLALALAVRLFLRGKEKF